VPFSVVRVPGVLAVAVLLAALVLLEWLAVPVLPAVPL
jgi:hypothetical protein